MSLLEGADGHAAEQGHPAEHAHAAERGYVAEHAHAAEATPVRVKHPLYPRLLHLRNIHPNAWQRAVLGEGAIAIAVLLVLADLATAWTLLVLPLAVAAVVKAHDLLAGALGSAGPDDPPA
jgi:hypothetical protein